MLKYSSELKATIVNEYLTGQSSAKLAKRYQVPQRRIQKWVQNFRLSGIKALKNSRHKRSFTLDYKLTVVNYYLTHEVSLAEVGAHFNLKASLAGKWVSDFQHYGIAALEPQRKGRSPKLKKDHSPRRLRHLAKRTEIDRLKEELAKKNQELHETKLELEIAKKSLTLFGPSKHVPKHK